MNNSKQAHVNEYLFYAQKLLQVESKQLAGLDKIEMSAIHASVYLCLKKSWDNWLQELSDYMDVTLQDFSSLTQAGVQNLPESQCLLAFKQDADSWLNRLLDRVDDNYKPAQPEHIQAAPNKINASLLDVVLIDSEASVVKGVNGKITAGTEPLAETDILILVMKEFKHYMKSVRSRQAEW